MGNLVVMDPRGSSARQWNKLYIGVGILSLFIDPLFLMVPEIWRAQLCIQDEKLLLSVLTMMRSFTDLFYFVNIIIQFQMGFISPSSRVFGRGELVVDPKVIALRYLKSNFLIDLMAALPLPQVYFWGILPKLMSFQSNYELHISIRFIILIQLLHRLILAYPLSIQIARETGLISRKAWFGAAYNLLFLILSSNVCGSCWYLFAISRQVACWRSVCKDSEDSTFCGSMTFFSFSCPILTEDPERTEWLKKSNVTGLCQPGIGVSDNSYYQFGIYLSAVTYAATSAPFSDKLFFSAWWGLQTLCNLGQNITTSIYISENVFAMLVVTLGLVNYALVISNIQIYLESATTRLEEWRLKRNDTEQWMHHRELPRELRQSIRKYDRYKWVANNGVNEESILKRLPTDLQRQIKRQLCISLVRRVPLFNQMDDRMLDSVCERLKPALCTGDTLLISEGEPLTEMLFVVRGHLDSYTTNGGRAGFFNCSRVGPGDFCGDEILTWALEMSPSSAIDEVTMLPLSTRTVKAVTDVEAFTLRVEDVKFVALQFRRLHSGQLRHTFQFYSHQWRLWAACYIQAAWRRYKKRKLLGGLVTNEEGNHGQQWVAEHYGPMALLTNTTLYEEMEVFVPRPGSGMAVYAARLMADVRRGSSNRFGPDSYAIVSSLGDSFAHDQLRSNY